jgi:hypothetical protein
MRCKLKEDQDGAHDQMVGACSAECSAKCAPLAAAHTAQDGAEIRSIRDVLPHILTARMRERCGKMRKDAGETPVFEVCVFLPNGSDTRGNRNRPADSNPRSINWICAADNIQGENMSNHFT